MTGEDPVVKISFDESKGVEEFLTHELSADAFAKGFEYKPTRFYITIRERGDLVAALSGEINWQWVYIKKLAVNSHRRKQGLGSELIRSAIQVANDKQCRGIWVDTFSFQSPNFYNALGFTEVGRIQGYPAGHDRIIFQMQLS